MRHPIVQLATASLASVLLYLLLVFAGLHKPLTTGTVLALESRRAAYIASHPGPKIVIIAGSNGLYSFRCETIAAVLGRPCVNLSIGVQAGLNYDLIRVNRVLDAGDVVVMPYEFEIYDKPDAMLYGGLSSQLMVQNDRATLWSLPATRIIADVFSFDARFVIEAVAESLFFRAGLRGYFTPAAFTPEGDYAIGDAAMAHRYVADLQQQNMATPDADVMQHPSGAQDMLKRFFVTAAKHGVTVIGTLPTTFNDRPYSPAPIARIESFYRDNGAQFLVLPNQDQYPRSCFLDSRYHLAETCQIKHSHQFAEMLKVYLAAHAAPAAQRSAAGAPAPI